MDFEWMDYEVPDDMAHHILSFLDVQTLLQKKVVCRSWQLLVTKTIYQKASIPKAFESCAELREAVQKYTKYNIDDSEEFAQNLWVASW
eukprot:scaffold122170_cov56-Attheya_sp.AAC.1